MSAIDPALGSPDLAALCPRTLSALPHASRLVLAMLDELQGGALAVLLPEGRWLRVGQGALVAQLRVHDHALFARVLAQGDIGLAESWMDGLWETDALPGLLIHLASNRAHLEKAMHGRVLSLLGHRLWHRLRANTRAGARRNIEAHYDLGNDFYALWLDDSMTYSSAVFESPDDSLEQAQQRKYRRILDRIGARPGQHILEIGCGWGGFAQIAATEYGCRVRGVTLSPAQLAHARARVERGGFDDRVDLRLCDYRDIDGQYDHIVSIEMIEAVGEQYWPTYFAQLSARLRPGGYCMVQAITISDALFERYRRGTDFIQRHVFPGGMLPAPSVVQQQARQAGLAVVEDYRFGQDYAGTLAGWLQRFEGVLPQVRALGYPERFIRLWRFYLAYCEAGFRADSLDVHHYLLSHAD